MAPRKILPFFLLLLACSQVTGRGLDEIKRSGKIYVAFTTDDLKNINYDLALEFARYLNVDLIEVVIDWEEAFMQDGTVPGGLETDPDLRYTPDALRKSDIICSTFTIIEWRKKLFGFAETLQSAELLMIRKNEEMPEDYTDLAGKKIAYMGATTFEQHLEQINRSIGGGIRMVPTGSSAETQRLIEEGKVYGIVLDADEALNFNAAGGQKYRIAFPISDVNRTAWAVDKNNPLIQEVENFFETIAGNGVLDEIFHRRFRITYSAYLDMLNRNQKLVRYTRDLQEILASGKIVVALRERNFIYRQNGQKQFMHALAEEFADYLGVSLEFVITPYFGRYWETREGKIFRDSSYTPDWFNYFDLACEVIAPLPWRTNKVNLVPVYPSAYTVVAKKETDIRSMEDLAGLRGVTEKETVYEDILRKEGITNYYYEPINKHIPDVAAGKADYTIIYNAFYELSPYPDLEVKLELGSLDVSWALRKDQPELQQEVERFISRSRERGLIRILLRALTGNTLQSPEAFLHSYYESFQTGQLPYVNYGAEDGLPQEDVFSIFQDGKGYLWFGTNSGAVRYNGREMVVFNHDQGLPGNSVRDIQQDSGGLYYFATTGGIAKFRGDTTLDILQEGTSFNKVFVDSKDRKWFIGADGLYMENAAGEVKFLNETYPVLPGVIYNITEDRTSGHLFLATVLGIYLVDPEGESVNRLSQTDCYSLYIDPADSIWFSTREGLFIAHLGDLESGRVASSARSLNKRLRFPADVITDIIPNHYGSVWLVTDSRILQVISTDQEPIVYEQEIGIKNNKILSFLIDREDNLWIGFSGGLQRLTNRRGLRNFYPGMIDSYIYSIFQDERGRIWITSDNGIYYFRDDQISSFAPPGGTGDKKYTGTLLPDGNILFANSQGLYEISSRTLGMVRQHRFSQIAHSPENLFVSSRGKIFLLTGINGIIYYFPDFQSDPLHLKNRCTSNIMQLIEVDGQVMGGTSSGVVVFNGETFVLLEGTDCNVWSLMKDQDRVWLGTDCGIGLANSGHFDQIELSGFDRDLVIKSMIPAKNRNYLWVGTNKGFSYFNKETKEFEFTINTKDGLSGDEITPGGLFIDGNDLLWVGTYHGISNFNIRARSSNPFAPVCYIEKMFLNGELTDPLNNREFSHRENNLVFEISALSFSDETSVEYEYYLRGTGHNYSSYHRGREYRANYNNLPPGHYEFIYKAKGKNNIWGYAEKYEFSIRKAWYHTWVFRFGVILTILLGTYLFYLIRISTIKAQKKRLEQQVRERTHELEVANTEIEAQRDYARYQRDQIAQQQKSIMDSINYAQTIQNSLLPSSSVLGQLLADHFILFKPRDVVSGDFYWISEHRDHFFVAAADCTGHGVPGAFMSMLGMALMNEIVNKQPEIDPAELLNQLRSQIILTLHQKGMPGAAKDGMDIVVCKISKDREKMWFAGANNPLYLIRNGELTEFKTDKMPVSIHEIMKPFSGFEAGLRPDDAAYVFSDGFADQFGGPFGKKFKYRNFKELLLSVHSKEMHAQVQLLDEAFEKWRGDLQQIDDVVVIGMKF